MTTALQQQVFALDAKYNAIRVPKSPNYRTLYIRRRSQLLRDTDRDQEKWKQYLRLRALLLQQKYGPTELTHKRSISRTSLTPMSTAAESVIPTRNAEASKAIVGGNSIAENYAFVGVHHIYDQHTAAVTMIKFANNDRAKLCCSSVDKTLSICDVTTSSVIAILRGHDGPVTCFDWSINNDLLVSTSLDGTMRVWSADNCLRTVREPNKSQLLCCIFQPANNNLVIVGNGRGEIRVANVSTGRFLQSVCRVGGNVLSVASETNGKIIWAGNDKGEIVSAVFDVSGGLQRTRKLTLGVACSVTSLSYRAWISREARDPSLLINCSNNAVCLFSVTDDEGELRLKRKFQNCHQKHLVKSIFCPIMSFRQGACVVTGSEDGNVYFLDIEKTTNKARLNTLQGHACAVLGVSFNYNESLLATSDLEGLVIIWKRSESLMV
ncbi:PREDICTED: WD repeat-containing protein 13-like [Nicrophorus vespilloides]|uniref:WD repeat-containing protein 13-like n=1 Tax=Nicrophorus vespilloides TaxID=110193 RepID=A0ABM1MDA1_NICVS|nr:PREDICTED: WD repeat-containing protein 13-like [Nicrophorus vespilloides]